MTKEQLQEFLTKRNIEITIPPQKGELYTRYFVEASGFYWDWTICEDVEGLKDVMQASDSQEFDDIEYKIEPALTVRSIGLSENQFDVFRAYFEQNQNEGWL